MAKKLIESQSWAQNVRNCLSRFESWSCNGDHDLEKVQMELVDKLLSLSPAPCIDSAYLKLKVMLICVIWQALLLGARILELSDYSSINCVQDYQKKAIVLIQEIDSVLSSCPNISVSKIIAVYASIYVL